MGTTHQYVSPQYFTLPLASGDSPVPHSIKAHPTVPFWAIINPNSGPGRSGSQAPTEYQQCIPKLRASNVVVLGYVPTSYGATKRKAGVTADVNTYAGWKAAYKPDGIFFDEVSGKSADLATYTTFASHARSSFKSGKGFVSAPCAVMWRHKSRIDRLVLLL